jgi:dihydropyrimidinase
MHLDKVIRGGTIVTADDTYKADVGIAGEKIGAIGLALEGAETLDATGKLVMPGGIDVHTHLDMPFGGTVTADDWTSGTTAAACGGTTTVIDFAIQDFGKSLRLRCRRRAPTRSLPPLHRDARGRRPRRPSSR